MIYEIIIRVITCSHCHYFKMDERSSYGTKQRKQSTDDVSRSNTSTSVLIMGFKEVGKTALLHQLQKLISRDLGLDERRRRSDADIMMPQNLQFSEASQFSFKGLRKRAIRASGAFVLVYAVNDEESFSYVTKILGEILSLKGSDVNVIVVANKIDMTTRKVHPVMADCVVTIDYECRHRELCAKSGEGVRDILLSLLGYHGDELILPEKDVNKSILRQSKRKSRRRPSVFRK